MFRDNSPRPFLLAITLGLLAAATPLSGQVERKVTQLADGVYEIQHQDALDGFAGGVNLTSFRLRFAGNDKDLSPSFDDAAANLVNVVFREASLR